MLLSAPRRLSEYSNVLTYIHTYHSQFFPEGVAEASQIFFRYLAMTNTADVTGGKSIAVYDLLIIM
jgi:hypothetical protein